MGSPWWVVKKKGSSYQLDEFGDSCARLDKRGDDGVAFVAFSD
jgi:hypothetical protein